MGWYKGRGTAHSGTHESIEWNREFHFLSYSGFVCARRRVSCLMFTSVPFAMRMRADGILICVSCGVAEKEIEILRLDGDHIRMPKGPRRCWSCIPLHAKWLSRKPFSTLPTTATKKPYASTLRLPKTRFPLWSEPDKREVPFRERTTNELYKWQVRGF